VPYANLGDPQSLNLYAYVGDDPANHADPDGHIEGAAGEPDSPGCNSQNTSGCKSTKTKSDRAATITVTVEQVKASTLFGHVVVKVGTGSAVGLVPDSGKSAVKAVAKEAASAATIGVPLPSPVSGHVESLEPNRIVEATATLQVTIDQAQAMQATVTQAEAHPQQYDPAFHNCASFVEDVLRSGGINVPEDMTPGGLVTDLKHQNPQWL
jgi:hypothetical protein